MATFKREIKKLPSEQNLRLLSSLVISLANKTSSVEDKCITPWKAGETYQKDVSFVVYNRYIYSCSVTNKDDAFTESHWTKLADNFDELSVDDIKAFLNLTPEQIQTLSSIILDAEVRLDKTWSSSKIYTDIKQCLDDSKAYTLAELGKASGASYKVVSSTGEMTEQKYIYLMSDGSGSYNMYIVEDDGSTTQIGNTNINLSDYYTKTEIDSDFLKKTDADGKYATITTVDGKVDKTSILTSTPSTVTNEQVYSAFVMNTILSGKEGVANYIAEPIDVNTVTKNIKGWCENLTGTTPNGGTAGWFENEYTSSNTMNQKYISPDKVMYIRSMFGGTWSDWKKVCTTSVADIPTTTITPTFPSSVKIGKMHFIRYSVKNGWANVSVILHLDSAPKTDWFPIANNLPKPDKEIIFSTIGESNANVAPIAFRLEKLDEGRTLEMMVGAGFTVPNWYNVNFSYPVAES